MPTRMVSKGLYNKSFAWWTRKSQTPTIFLIYSYNAISHKDHLKEIGKLARNATVSNMFSLPLETGVYSTRRDFAPWGINSFFLGYIPFPEGFWEEESKHEVTKVVPFKEVVENT